VQYINLLEIAGFLLTKVQHGAIGEQCKITLLRNSNDNNPLERPPETGGFFIYAYGRVDNIPLLPPIFNEISFW
jgi:hypothetical protein